MGYAARLALMEGCPTEVRAREFQEVPFGRCVESQ
jgi:hypothetical protein